MQSKLKKWTIFGIFIVFLLAAFWHFLYDLLPSDFIGAISPVNESPWEHAKLFFIPVILYYVALYFIVGKEYPNFIFGHSIALLVMPIFMLLFYYAYKTLLPGQHLFVLDMINSLLTVLLGAFVGYKLTTSNKDFSGTAYDIIAMIIVIGMLTVYVVFTFNPPICDMFLDKTQGKYGI